MAKFNLSSLNTDLKKTTEKTSTTSKGFDLSSLTPQLKPTGDYKPYIAPITKVASKPTIISPLLQNIPQRVAEVPQSKFVAPKSVRGYSIPSYASSEKLLADNPIKAGVQKGFADAFGMTGRVGAIGENITKQEEKAPDAFKKASYAGRIGGELTSYITAGKIAKSIPVLQKLGTAGKLSGRLAIDQVIDNIAQAPRGVLKDISEDKSIDEITKNLIKQNVIDLAFNVTIAGAGGIFNKLKNTAKSTGQSIEEVAETVIKNPTNRKSIQQELGLPDNFTAKDMLDQQSKLAKEIGAENYYKSTEQTPQQINADFQTWRSKNFGGSTGQLSPGDMSATKELYKEATGIDVDALLKETLDNQASKLKLSDRLASEIPKVEPSLQDGPFNMSSLRNIEPVQPQKIASTVEQPTLTTDLPKTPKQIKETLEEGTKLRKTIHNSLMQSELPEEMKTFFKENPSTYKTISNVDTWDDAIKNVSNDFEGTLNKFKGKDTLESASDTGEAIALLHRVSKDNISEANTLAQEFAEKATKSGQAIQAIVMLQKTTPEGKLVQAHNILKNATKKIEDELPSVYANMKAKGTLPTLTDDEAKFIVDNMTQSQNATGKEKARLIAQVDQMLSDKIPATLGDKIKALRNLALLGNFKTIGSRNPLGNTIFGGLENISQIPSGITDVMVSKLLKTQRQTPIVPNLKAQVKGFGKGTKDVISDIKLNIDTSPTRGGIEIPRSRKIFELSWLNKANNWLGDALKLGDRPFYQAAYDMRLSDLKKLGVQGTDEELEKLASEFALQRVFQNNGETAKAVANFKSSVNDFANLKQLGIDFGLGDVAMPYTQTPANILAKGLEYTPLNIINIGKMALGGTSNASGGLGKVGKNIALNQKQFTDSVGRLFTGTGVIALGYALAKNGNVTGKSTDKSSKVKNLKRDIGEKDYSIKIGDTWHSYDWAQPAATPLAVGIDAYLAGETEEDFLKRIEKGIISGGDTIFRQSLFRGVTNMFGGQYGTPTEGLIDTALTSPTQFMSTLGGQAAQFKDPYERVVDYDSPTSQVKDTFKKKVPQLRETLPKQINILGQPKLEQPGKDKITKAFDTFINPSIRSVKTKEPTLLEIERLFKSTKETGVIPSKMPTGLSKEQEYDFKQKFGQVAEKELSKLFTSNAYKGSNDENKAKITEQLINSVYKKTKDELGY